MSGDRDVRVTGEEAEVGVELVGAPVDQRVAEQVGHVQEPVHEDQVVVAQFDVGDLAARRGTALGASPRSHSRTVGSGIVRRRWRRRSPWVAAGGVGDLGGQRAVGDHTERGEVDVASIGDSQLHGGCEPAWRLVGIGDQCSCGGQRSASVLRRGDELECFADEVQALAACRSTSPSWTHRTPGPSARIDRRRRR